MKPAHSRQHPAVCTGEHRSASSLTLRVDDVSTLFPLLQRGFMVKAGIGCSIRNLLCGQLGIAPEFVDERIQTIFLDGKTVDDVDGSVVSEGSTLALSAAMPGLVGATLRKGGPLASMRSQISHHPDAQTAQPAQGFFTMKIFNLLIPELGPHLLETGIWLDGEAFQEFLAGRPPQFWTGCRSAQADGVEIDGKTLGDAIRPDAQRIIFLKAVSI